MPAAAPLKANAPAKINPIKRFEIITHSPLLSMNYEPTS
jgi:hypothetical protein